MKNALEAVNQIQPFRSKLTQWSKETCWIEDEARDWPRKTKGSSSDHQSEPQG